MKEIAQWLLKIEHIAGTLYKNVAERLRDDEAIAVFFSHLADEEAAHFKVMKDCLEHLERHTVPPSDITVDNDTESKIESAFEAGTKLLSTGGATKTDILHCLATTEFSEWNKIFLYAVNTIKEERQFMSVAASMHHHVKEIEQFLESLPEGRDILHLIKNLPCVWKEQILIVEDSPPIADFLRRLLSDVGQVETAENGADALQKVKEKHFDVIISDVQMPVMDGVQFYREASAFDPQISQRILFYSGGTNAAQTAFFRSNNLRYLAKPASIREIMRKVHEIMPNGNLD